MTTPPARLAALTPALFVLLWSTGFIGARLGLPYAEPLTFLSIRYLLVIAAMSIAVAATRARWPAPRQAAHIAVTGLLVHGVYLGGVFTSIHRGLPAGVSALVVGLQPLLSALGAGWLLGAQVSRRQWIGLALGFAGVALVVSDRIAFADAPDRLGAMLVPSPSFAALLGITAGTLYQKRFCPRFELATGAIMQFVPTLLVSASVARATETMHVEWSGQFLFALSWLVVVLSLGAVSLLNLLIRRGTAVDVASLFYLTPPTTAVMAWAFFGETLSGLALAGMVVAVGGVWLARKG
jgi:drug/metabolite transporter (DMT)-like permease